MTENSMRPEQSAGGESPVEAAKRKSRYLRGTLAETLASDAPSFEHDDMQLLKFHGVYQQDDRDKRAEARKTGAGKAWIFMARVKIPGGALTAGQYLALDEIAALTYGSLRATTREGIQFHGILKGNLKALIRRINEALLSTLAACGDVSRNVMACPAPVEDPGARRARALAAEFARALCPATPAYHEIWLDGEKHMEAQAGPVEPFYGEVYLPRKFKIGIAPPEDNCVDIYTHDLGFIAELDASRERLLGANVLVGGGFGMAHGKPETFARLATPLGYVEADQIIETGRIVAAIFRDHGNREDRKQARLKYMIEKWGIERFREEFQRRAPFALRPARDLPPVRFHDHLGLHPQGGGRWFYGVAVPSGRVADGAIAWKTTFRRIVEELRPGVVITPQQNFLFTDLDERGAQRVEEVLAGAGIPLADSLTPLRRHHMTCVSLPTCGLALAESERAMPGILDEFEAEFQRLGIAGAPVSVRITGCPNGCARPYNADIAFVGRGPGLYDIYVGGRLDGDRLADLYTEKVKSADLLAALRPLLEAWARERGEGEGLGDFYQRAFGSGGRRTLLTGAKDHPELPAGAALPPRRGA